MFNLISTLTDRRNNTTTALPKTAIDGKDKDALNTFKAWTKDVQALRDVCFTYALQLDGVTPSNVFDAWKKLFRYFPEKLVGTKLKAQAEDVNALFLLCGKYAVDPDTLDADAKHKAFQVNSANYFRKGVEDLIVDRVMDNRAKTPAEQAADAERRRVERAKRKEENEKRVAALLGCTQEDAKKYIKAQAKKRRKERMDADFTSKERAAANKLDKAEDAQKASTAA